jgi:hypothetical protein
LFVRGKRPIGIAEAPGERAESGGPEGAVECSGAGLVGIRSSAIERDRAERSGFRRNGKAQTTVCEEGDGGVVARGGQQLEGCQFGDVGRLLGPVEGPLLCFRGGNVEELSGKNVIFDISAWSEQSETLAKWALKAHGRVAESGGGSQKLDWSRSKSALSSAVEYGLFLAILSCGLRSSSCWWTQGKNANGWFRTGSERTMNPSKLLSGTVVQPCATTGRARVAATALGSWAAA